MLVSPMTRLSVATTSAGSVPGSSRQFTVATAVNARGDVIGDSNTTGDAGYHATLWHT